MINNILIVDKTDRDRGRAVAERFVCTVNDVYFYGGETTFTYQNGCWSEEYAQNNYDLVMLHGNDIGCWNAYDSRTMLPIIKYTGGNPLEKDADETWIRKRSIDGAEDGPTEQEVEEIIKWGNHILAEKKDPPIPSLFVAPEVMNYLPALAILCQGYLVVHASNGGDNIDSLKPALNQMGWFDLGEDREKIYKSLSDNKEEVKSANWWFTPFGLDGSEMDDSKWNEFKEIFLNEKKDAGEEDWSTVERFIDENIKKKEFDSPETIANVYCSLVSMLEGRPCSM